MKYQRGLLPFSLVCLENDKMKGKELHVIYSIGQAAIASSFEQSQANVFSMGIYARHTATINNFIITAHKTCLIYLPNNGTMYTWVFLYAYIIKYTIVYMGFMVKKLVPIAYKRDVECMLYNQNKQNDHRYAHYFSIVLR